MDDYTRQKRREELRVLLTGYRGSQIQNIITRSPVGQMIGGYLVEAEVIDDEIHYKIDNDMSYKSYSSSYLGGEGADYPRSIRREMGTIPMTLGWSEKIKR